MHHIFLNTTKLWENFKSKSILHRIKMFIVPSCVIEIFLNIFKTKHSNSSLKLIHFMFYWNWKFVWIVFIMTLNTHLKLLVIYCRKILFSIVLALSNESNVGSFSIKILILCTISESHIPLKWEPALVCIRSSRSILCLKQPSNLPFEFEERFSSKPKIWIFIKKTSNILKRFTNRV